MFEKLNLQMFADAGTLTNTTQNYVNSYTGDTQAFPEGGGMTSAMKTFYDTELLDNAREELIFAQLGRQYTLPQGRGKTVEWRKWNTLPDADELVEGVIPTGKKFGQTSYTVPITQHGMYVSISDQLELHAIDDVIIGAMEELGAATGKTRDKLVRNVLSAGTNVLYAPKEGGAENALRTDLDATSLFTSDMVAKAVTTLKKGNAKKYDGRWYVAVVNPSVAYDLRKDKDWIEYHKYSAAQELFTGEIGELHGVRFVESNLAPVIDNGSIKIYQTMFFGKDAFGVINPEGAGMETIIKDKNQAGGPLNQFSTVGAKFSMAAKILYPEAMVIVESASSYSDTDEVN